MIRMKSRCWFKGFAAVALVVAAGAGAHGQTNVATSLQAPPKQLVILDTDIGDDIDDAFALALLLRSPEVKLLGITTAFGDTPLRARLVDRYLAAVGRDDIPVMAGVQTPATNHFTQAAYALQEPERKHGDAIGFLLREIAAHPGEITLIAIGPLFNEQAAIARDPAAFRKLKRVVLMGGSVYQGYRRLEPAPVGGMEYSLRSGGSAVAACLWCSGLHDAPGLNPGPSHIAGARGRSCARIAAD